MKAIYKRELASYFKSMMGYIFMFFVLFMVGIYFVAYNLVYAYPSITYTLSGVIFLFLAAIPFLTMRVLSEERKQKTDQLLLTAPVNIKDVVCGKYFALITVYAIPILIISLYPLVLSMFGKVDFVQNYTAVFGFFLLGSAQIAIGMFISSISESQVVSAVLTFVVLFLCYLVSGLETLFTDTAKLSFGVIVVLGIAFSIFLFFMTKNARVAVGVGVLFEVFAIILYVTKSTLYEGVTTKILEVFNVDGRFQSFISGTIDLTAIFYLLSVVFVFNFLTVQSMNKRRWS